MIDFSLDGKDLQAVMSLYKGNEVKSWYNYHITKHVIGDFLDESFFRLVGLSENETKDIRNIQLNNYYCGQERSRNFPDICYKCNYVDSCSETLKNVRGNYYKLIKDSLFNDKSKPRHAHVLKERKTKQELIVLNISGVSIVMKEKADRFHVMTCYRLRSINRYKIQEKYSFMDDDEICLEESKMMWRRRFRGTGYSYVKEHQSVNWDPIEQ
jgi:hypothetical protein|tara:strand:+ start:302 stop:937 length:636 start_codon:yes stop_codon:yes gene_type:complete